MKRKAAIFPAILMALALLASGNAFASRADALIAKGNRAYKKGKYEEATKFYREALNLDPTSAAATYNLGTALAKKGDFEEAAKWLDQAGDDPASPLRRNALFNEGFSQAKPAIDAAQKLGTEPAPPSPKDIDANIEKLKGARETYREIIKDELNNPEARSGYQTVLSNLKKLEEQKKAMSQQNGGQKGEGQNSKDDAQKGQQGEGQPGEQQQEQQQGKEENKKDGQQDQQGQEQKGQQGQQGEPQQGQSQQGQEQQGGEQGQSQNGQSQSSEAKGEAQRNQANEQGKEKQGQNEQDIGKQGDEAETQRQGADVNASPAGTPPAQDLSKVMPKEGEKDRNDQSNNAPQKNQQAGAGTPQGLEGEKQDSKDGKDKDKAGRASQDEGLEKHEGAGDKGKQEDVPQPYAPAGEAKPGEGAMSADQMNALRVLQALEDESPEQYKKLLQFNNRSAERNLQKPW